VPVDTVSVEPAMSEPLTAGVLATATFADFAEVRESVA